MTTLQISSIKQLDVEYCNKYEGIAFDGCHFYLTLPNCCEVHIFDHSFCRKECVSTSHGYTSLCYDCRLKCFWALSCTEPSRIYQLDCCLKEIDYIFIKSYDNIPIILTGVTCGGGSNSLLVSYKSGIAKISTTDNNAPVLLKKALPGAQCTSVELINEGFLYSFSKSSNQTIAFCYTNGDTSSQCCIPEEYSIEDMTTITSPCSFECSGTFYVLATKQCCYSYLLKCTLLCREEKCHDCCDDGCHDCSHDCCNDGCHDCSHDCCDDGCHDCSHDCCHDGCHDCSHDCCHDGSHDCCHDCHPGCHPCPPPKPKPPNCILSANDIIESIALIEAALSHILNAEGEKIQKILSCAKSTNEIMTVNEAVNKTIINITHLEHVLYAKLQLAKELCQKKRQKPCDPCDPCCKPCEPCCEPCSPCCEPCSPCCEPCQPCCEPPTNNSCNA